MKILIVDDDRFSQLVCELAVRSLGPSFQTVGSGVDAIKALENAASVDDPFDVVLLDFVMQGMDGFETAKLIKNHSNQMISKVRLIGLSGNKGFEEQKKALDSGMEYCVSKPVSAQALQRVLWPNKDSYVWHAKCEDECGEVLFDSKTLTYLSEETDAEVVQKVVQSFLKNLPFYVDQISQGFAQGQSEQVRRYSHILKSSSGTVGAVLLQQMAEDFERDSDLGDSLARQRKVQVLKDTSEKVTVILTHYLEKLCGKLYEVKR